MAMSKRWFVVVIVGLVLILGAVVGVVIWSKNKSSEPNTSDEVVINEQSSEAGTSLPQEPWSKKSKAECQRLVRENSLKIEYSGSIPRSSIATRQTVLSRSGSKVVRNAYWLSGDPREDTKTLQGIKAQGCEGSIPVIVIKMRPTEGLTITDVMKHWDFYKPSSPFETWSAYDKKLNTYLRELASIPAVVLLEPDLLMFAFDSTNQQYRWKNEIYENEFLQRAQKVIAKLSKAWVYVDAGNAGYLSSSAANMEQMATTLLRLDGLRGFALNTGHFVNKTYNDYIAKKLYCKTGLHYITDTSRNAGSFSMQAIHEIEKCPFDPPNLVQGLSPGWGWGSNREINRVRRWINQLGESAPREQPNIPYRTNNNQQNGQNTGNQKPQQPGPNQQIDEQNRDVNNRNNNNNNNNRNLDNNNNQNNNQNSQRIISNNQHSGNSNPSGEQSRSQYNIRSAAEAAKMLRIMKSNSRQCLSSPLSRNMAHDANVWIKTPGVSDGRLYPYGTVRPCLMGHTVGCDDDCKMLVQQGISRPQQCFCDVRRPASSSNQNSNSDSLSGFPF